METTDAAPILTIIIVNWNSGELLKNCLASIYNNTSDVSCEIFVVDNASSDKSIESAKKAFPQVQIVENKVNKGFAKANNQALKLCRGQYIVLLNPDTIVMSNTLEEMVRFMDNNSGAGAVGCKILDAQGRLQWSCCSFPTMLSEFFEITLLAKFFPNNKIIGRYLLSYWDHNSVREVDWLTGACLMVRKDAVNKAGLLDENFFMYGEDADWCYRIKKHNFKNYYLPEVHIIHQQGASSNQIYGKMLAQRYRSRFLFFKKHYGQVKMHTLKIMVFLGYLARLIMAGLFFTDKKIAHCKEVLKICCQKI